LGRRQGGKKVELGMEKGAGGTYWSQLHSAKVVKEQSVIIEPEKFIHLKKS